MLENGRLEGKEIKRLMRQNRMTIRAFKSITGITLKRIREVFEEGLEPGAARDWVQHITGTDPGPL